MKRARTSYNPVILSRRTRGPLRTFGAPQEFSRCSQSLGLRRSFATPSRLLKKLPRRLELGRARL